MTPGEVRQRASGCHHGTRRSCGPEGGSSSPRNTRRGDTTPDYVVLSSRTEDAAPQGQSP